MAFSKDAGQTVPRHVAVIMDGNGRWAQKRLLPRSAGHRAGMKRVISLAEHAFSRGVEVITLFALSTENLSRPKEELDALFSLFCEYFTDNVKKLEEKGVRLKIIGNLELVPANIRTLAREGEERTKNGKGGTLVLAIAYGGRQEILSAVNAAVKEGKPVSEEDFSARLYTSGLPEPDLMIRTGKEKRISNFLLWELAYTELYFSDKMFPSFTNRDFDCAIEEYLKRERRFGKVNV